MRSFAPSSRCRITSIAGAALAAFVWTPALARQDAPQRPIFRSSIQLVTLDVVATDRRGHVVRDLRQDEFQIVEARAHRADAILLIVAALTDAELRTLRAAAKAAELDVLCEVHDREELQRALDLGCEMFGVNSRNLRTFEVNTAEAEKLAELLPTDAVRVAESGIGSAGDIRRMLGAGYDAFLIGESLMRKDDPGDALAALLQPQLVAAE